MQQADLQLQQQQQQQQQQLQQNGDIGASGGGGGVGANAIAGGGAGGKKQQISGGRFDFEDGGTYCGGWEEGKAHGFGVCTGPKHQGAYSGAWNYGFEWSGAYIWPSGSHYEGQWQNGRRHGLGVEQIGRQLYRGEWSKEGHKGRYGVRESTVSTAKYEGTWNKGYQDGYGCETYADGGKYQGQWQDGKRHGYGIRTSAPFGLASHHRRKNLHASTNSLGGEGADSGGASKSGQAAQNGRTEEIRGGFVLTAKSDKLPQRRNSVGEKSKRGFLSGLRRRQRSTGDLEKRGTLASGSIRSTMSTTSWLSTGSEQSNLTAKSTHTESNASFPEEDEQLDPTVVETYMGEWKKDKRCGYGVAERSDGLKYEGEWYNNKKHGYGVTTFRDGTVEEGKYKNNILITSQKKKHLFLARSRKFRERITASVNSAQRALKMAMQRSDIAISRTATAALKAQNADAAAEKARMDCELAVQMAREFAPDFKPTVLERFEKLRFRERYKGPPPSALLPGQQQAMTTMMMMNHTGAGAGGLSASVSGSPIDPYGGAGGSAAMVAATAATGAAARQQNRRPSQQVQLDPEFPVPSTMYSQQIPVVTPQTDLSALVNQPQGQHTSISAINQMTHHAQASKNPAYQFQQQQPPGANQLGIGGNVGVMGAHMYSNSIRGSIGSGMANIGLPPGSGTGAGGAGAGAGASSAALAGQGSPQARQAQLDAAARFRESDNMHLYEQQQQLQQQQQQQQQHLLQQQQHQQQQLRQQQQLQFQQLDGMNASVAANTSPSHQQAYNAAASIRRQSQGPQGQQSTSVDRGGRAPMLGQVNKQQESSIDHFDHYKRPPSRDSSIDRYARAASRLSGTVGAGYNSRQASVDRNGPSPTATPTANRTDMMSSRGSIGGVGGGASTPDGSGRQRAGSVFRGGTPVPGGGPGTPTAGGGTPITGNGSVITGTGRLSRAGTPSLGTGSRQASAASIEPLYSKPNQPFEDVLLRQRTLGQDIIPSPLQPKRTESLYMAPKPVSPLAAATKGGGGGGGGKKIKSVPINVTLQRKKSLPDFQELPRATGAMSREEVSALGSARREAVRREIETNERLKANPLLYLVSPQVKDWFSRQQLLLVILVVNILLGILFFKMLT